MKVLLSTLLMTGMMLGQVPATYFGMHINRPQTPWPSVAFGSYRLWDDGTAWATLNPANNVYNWSPLDAWVSAAEQHHTELLYTFGRTPAWASSAPSTACNYGNGQCVAPADFATWDRYVTALVTRYKGRIKRYEMWNEPNDLGFWKGTTAQLVEMTRRASQIIHSVDPSAEVVSLGATWTTTTAWAWLDGYLTAGAGPYLDDIGFHAYTGNNNAEGILSIIDNIQNTQTAHGLNLPLIITEGGWGLNSVIPDQGAQAAFLAQRYLLVTSRPKVKAFYWYQWDNTSWGTLWDQALGVHTAGQAYAQVYKWLVGKRITTPCAKDSNGTFTCSMTNGPFLEMIAWNAGSTRAFPMGNFTAYQTLDGKWGTGAATVSPVPILLTTLPAPQFKQ